MLIPSAPTDGPAQLRVAVPDIPAALADAAAVIQNPDLAAQMPVTLRRMAWMIMASAHGRTVTQRRLMAKAEGTRT